MFIGLGSIADVTATIQKIEGWAPGTLSYRNNNPGNLRCQPSGVPFSYQSAAGATGCDSANFAVFSSADGGSQALNTQVTIDAGRGLSIQEFINKYAPADDGNNPTSYAAAIAAATGLSVTDPLSAALDGSTIPDTSGSSGESAVWSGISGGMLLAGAAVLSLLAFSLHKN